MCICINCLYVNSCKTYHLILKQHGEFNNSCKINFTPINTLIIVNISKFNSLNLLEWDLQECLSFVEKPGNWILR